MIINDSTDIEVLKHIADNGGTCMKVSCCGDCVDAINEGQFCPFWNLKCIVSYGDILERWSNAKIGLELYEEIQMREKLTWLDELTTEN